MTSMTDAASRNNRRVAGTLDDFRNEGESSDWARVTARIVPCAILKSAPASRGSLRVVGWPTRENVSLPARCMRDMVSPDAPMALANALALDADTANI